MPFFEYKEKKIFYQFKEKEKNRAIIFIHGSGEGSFAWKKQLSHLVLKYSLIAIDLPSHAESDDFPELSLEIYVDVVKKLVDFLNLNDIVLCGHSLGGAIVQQYFFRYPNKVSALILCSTGARLRVSPLILNTIKNNFQEFLDSIAVGFYRKTSKEVINDFLNHFSKTNPEVVYSDFKICDNFDVIDKLNSINIPCLIICGNRDILTPIKYSQYFKNKIPNSKLAIIKDAGHMVIFEKPNEVNQEIQDFIENYLENN